MSPSLENLKRMLRLRFDSHCCIAYIFSEDRVYLFHGYIFLIKKKMIKFIKLKFCYQLNLFFDIVKIQRIGTNSPSEQCRARSNCSRRCSLMIIYTNYHSICILKAYYCIVKQNHSIFRIITLIISGVPIFGNFTIQYLTEIHLSEITPTSDRYTFRAPDKKD